MLTWVCVVAYVATARFLATFRAPGMRASHTMPNAFRELFSQPVEAND